MDRYKTVTISVNIMKVNRIQFVISISQFIKFGTLELLPSQKMGDILTAIIHIKEIYMKRGFKIDIMLMDGEFEPLRGELAALQITLNSVSCEEQIPPSERRIRTLKERTRSIFNTLPFKSEIPSQMTVQMVYCCNFWLNIFPPTDGVSQQSSPRELITGQ